MALKDGLQFVKKLAKAKLSLHWDNQLPAKFKRMEPSLSVHVASVEDLTSELSLLSTDSQA